MVYQKNNKRQIIQMKKLWKALDMGHMKINKYIKIKVRASDQKIRIIK